jgi:hypothetical protein
MSKPRIRHVALGVLLCGAIIFLAHSLKTTSQSESNRGKRDAESRATKSRENAARPLAPGSVNIARYEGMIARNMFAPPRAPTPAESTGKATSPLPPLPPQSNPAIPATPRPKPLDLTGWSYAGYFQAGYGEGDDVVLGILQNESSEAVKYLGVGDEFLGAKVTSIDGEEIVFGSGGSADRLSVPRDFALSPLSASAPAAAGDAQAARGVPGQRPGPGANR